jgi:Carboxypeptidase regulatory-like domain/Phosphoesterase family
MLGSPKGWRRIRGACALAGAGIVAGGLMTVQAAPAVAPTISTHAATAAAASAAATTGPATCPSGYLVTPNSNGPPATAPHIMEIMMENASYGTTDGSPFVIGNSKAPYINNKLIGTDKYTSLTNWDSIEHNSPLLYMDAISGCDHNGTARPYPDPTLVNELDGVGTTWKAYMDGLAAGQTCYTGHGAGTNGYVQNHNPFIYFNQIISNTTECNANVLPYPGATTMVNTLDGANAPDFVWITPSTCDDMHSRCAPLNNLVAQGDTWLANNLPAVLASTWYTQGNGVVIITWDEGAIADVACPPWGGTSCGGHVATLVISQNSCGSFAGNGDEFGILHGIEAAYGVDFLNNSGGAGWNTADDITPAFADGACGGGGGTGTISGLVTSTQSGNPPLIGATVTCTCSGTNATTNGTGTYTFNNVPVGTYSMTFSDPGFVTQTDNNDVPVTSGNTTTENAQLAPSGAAPAVVQDVASGAKAAVTSFAVTTGATSAGNLLAVSTEFDAGSGKASGTVTGVTDNMHDIWTRAAAVNPTTRVGAEVWYSPNAVAGVTSVTVSYSTSVNPVVRFYEISGASTVDQAHSGSGSSTTPNSGSTATTAGANDVVIGDIGFVTKPTTISGLTPGFTNDPLLLNPLLQHQNAEQGGHEAASSTGTFSYSGTLSNSQVWAAVVATFK